MTEPIDLDRIKAAIAKPMERGSVPMVIETICKPLVAEIERLRAEVEHLKHLDAQIQTIASNKHKLLLQTQSHRDELQGALESALRVIDINIPPHKSIASISVADLRQARAALAKAKGGGE